MQSATTTLLSTLLDQLGQRGRIAALRYGVETMSSKLLSDEATRDIFLALVYELLKTDSAEGLLKAARG